MPRRPLPLGEPLKGTVSREKPEAFARELAFEEALRLEVDQSAVDVEVEILGPDGRRRLLFDSPLQRTAPETVCFVADEPGQHSILVRPFGEGRGPVSVRLLRQGPARPQDRLCAEASALFMAAEARWAERLTPELAADYARASGLWKRAGEPLPAAYALRKAGMVELRLGESAKARTTLHNALALAGEAGLATLEVSIRNQLGLGELDLGEIGAAAESFGAALAVARGIGDRYGEAAALNNQALVARTTGDTHAAIEGFEAAVHLWQEVGSRGDLAQTLLNLGDAHARLDHHDEARTHLERALDLTREVGDAGREASALTALGWMEHLRGEPGAAVEPLEKALALRRSHGHRGSEIAVLDRLGTVRRALADLEEAESLYRETLRLQEGIGDDWASAATRINLGCLHAAAGRPEPALAELDTAGELARVAEDPLEASQLEYCRAQAERLRGDLRAAQGHVEAALGIVEGLRSRASLLGARYRPIWLWQDYAELYRDLLMDRYTKEGREAFAVQAFEAVDRARARNLFESVLESQVGVRAATSEELLRRERHLQGRINALEARRRGLRASGAPEDATDDLEDELGLAALELEGARAAIRAADPRFAELAAPRPVGLAEVQELLDPGTLLLSYSLGAKRSFLFAVGRDSFAAFDLPPREEIDALAEPLYRALKESAFEPHQEGLVARELVSLLLPASALPPGTSRLLIVADGLLHYVPFAVLPSPSGGHPSPERLLVEDFELSYLPSASVLAALRLRDSDREKAPLTAKVFADAVFSLEDGRFGDQAESGQAGTIPSSTRNLSIERLPQGPLPRLSFTREEAEEIRAAGGASEVEVVFGFAATKAEALGGDLRPYRVLHFATHALIDERFPDLSGLVLSRFDAGRHPLDGDLHLHEIYGLDLRADLVVLSGCQTALGRRVRGDGLLSLTRGFLYAGSAQVLVSLWSVDDAATARLMGELYRRMLQGGESPSAALRGAQLWLRQQPRWQAPYYWAPFVLQGDAGN